VVFSTVFLSFEFPLNLPSALRFFLPAFFLSGFFFPASRFLGTSGIFRAALLFICQGSITHKMFRLVFLRRNSFIISRLFP